MLTCGCGSLVIGNVNSEDAEALTESVAVTVILTSFSSESDGVPWKLRVPGSNVSQPGSGDTVYTRISFELEEKVMADIGQIYGCPTRAMRGNCWLIGRITETPFDATAAAAKPRA